MSKRAWLLGYVEIYGLGLDYPAVSELNPAPDPADIQQVAQKYLPPENTSWWCGKKICNAVSAEKPPARKKRRRRMTTRSPVISLMLAGSSWPGMLACPGGPKPHQFGPFASLPRKRGRRGYISTEKVVKTK